MKSKIFVLLAMLLAFSIAGFAQSVKITEKTVKYNRPKTIEQEYKRTFEITYPKVAGAMGKKIESVLNYEKVFDFKLKDQLSGEETWLDGISYDVKYNKNNVLCVAIYMEGSGAYPSTSIVRKTIDARTGTLVKAANVFKDLNALAAKARIMQKAERVCVKSCGNEFSHSGF